VITLPQLPRKMVFALEAVVDVAFHARPDPVQAKDITRRQGIPVRYLEQVMQQLVRAGILKGQRGPRGGYTLARERRRISVGDVVRVVAEADGEAAVDGQPCSDLGRLVVRPLWRQAQAAMMAELDAVTLEDLCREARSHGLTKEGADRRDFAI